MKERRGVRRLIETDEMPIGVISEHSRKDQNVRKGHLAHAPRLVGHPTPSRLSGGADGHDFARSRR
jgi:hypothetical protein